MIMFMKSDLLFLVAFVPHEPPVVHWHQEDTDNDLIEIVYQKLLKELVMHYESVNTPLDDVDATFP